MKAKLSIFPFENEKSKIEAKINSMRLGNYLRKLMLRNNDLIDNEFIFLEHEDFLQLGNDDLNYSNMQMEDDDNEFRARVFSYKYAKGNQSFVKKGLRPYTVSPGNEQLDSNWKNYIILMMGKDGENKLLKVCFPTGLEENFAIITKFEKNCSNKIEKIKEYKILDGDAAKPNQVKTSEVRFKEKEVEKKKSKKHKLKKKRVMTEENKDAKYDQIIADLEDQMKRDKDYKEHKAGLKLAKKVSHEAKIIENIDNLDAISEHKNLKEMWRPSTADNHDSMETEDLKI
jgi:hypothetical protein